MGATVVSDGWLSASVWRLIYSLNLHEHCDFVKSILNKRLGDNVRLISADKDSNQIRQQISTSIFTWKNLLYRLHFTENSIMYFKYLSQ